MEKRVQRSDDNFAARWSQEVADLGFTMKPTCLVRCFNDFDLTPHEALLLDYLFSYWYKYDAPPDAWPAVSTIARALRMGYSTVGRHLRNLESKGFIDREERSGTSSVYHLSPTVDMVRSHVARSHPPQNRGDYRSDLSGQPSSDMTNKENVPASKRPNETNSVIEGEIMPPLPPNLSSLDAIMKGVNEPDE